MIVRPAVAADLPALLALIQGVADEHAALEPDYFRAGQAPVAARVRAAMASSQQLLLVAQRDGQVVGLLRAKVERIPDLGFLAGLACLKVSELAVAPATRRGGIGKALLAAAETWARQQGLDEVRLSVWSRNADALAFFDAGGYRPASQTRIKRLR